MAGNGEDVAREVGWVVGKAGANVVGLAPVSSYLVYARGKDGRGKVGEEGDELENTAVGGRS